MAPELPGRPSFTAPESPGRSPLAARKPPEGRSRSRPARTAGPPGHGAPEFEGEHGTL